MIGNAGGPTFQVYIMPQRLPRDIFVGTGCIFFAILNWIKVPPFIALGQFTAENLFDGLRTLSAGDRRRPGRGCCSCGCVSGERFYTLSYVLLIPVGLKLTWDGVEGLSTSAQKSRRSGADTAAFRS